jgi:glutaryl-CoA dehydrogenase
MMRSVVRRATQVVRAGAGRAGSAVAAGSTAARYRYDDPFDLDAQLSPDERQVRDQVRAYCSDHLMPRVLHANRSETFDRAIFPEMGRLGLLGATIDGYSCPGVSYVAYGLIAREVERSVSPSAVLPAAAADSHHPL